MCSARSRWSLPAVPDERVHQQGARVVVAAARGVQLDQPEVGERGERREQLLGRDAGQQRRVRQPVGAHQTDQRDGRLAQTAQQPHQRPGLGDAPPLQEVQRQLPRAGHRDRVVAARPSGRVLVEEFGEAHVEGRAVVGVRPHGRRARPGGEGRGRREMRARDPQGQRQSAEPPGQALRVLTRTGPLPGEIPQHLGRVGLLQRVHGMQGGPWTPRRRAAVPAGDQHQTGQLRGKPDPAGSLRQPAVRGQVFGFVGVVHHQQPRARGVAQPPPQQIRRTRTPGPGTVDEIRGRAQRGHHLTHPGAQRGRVLRGHPPHVDVQRGGVRGDLQGDRRLAATAHAVQHPHTRSRLAHQLFERVQQWPTAPDPPVQAPQRRSHGQRAGGAGLQGDRLLLDLDEDRGAGHHA